MPKRVLVVDDDENTRRFLTVALVENGYEAITAEDGDEGYRKVQETTPDLILLDVMMPKKTGFEVCQEVRQDESLKGTLILMLTAKGRETDVVKGMALGANAYMTKPFSTRDLVGRVRELLEDAD